MLHSPGSGRLLCGGREIAAATGLKLRQVFHHAEAGRLPCFRVGRSLFAREETLREWLAARDATPRQHAAVD